MLMIWWSQNFIHFLHFSQTFTQFYLSKSRNGFLSYSPTSTSINDLKLKTQSQWRKTNPLGHFSWKNPSNNYLRFTFWSATLNPQTFPLTIQPKILFDCMKIQSKEAENWKRVGNYNKFYDWKEKHRHNNYFQEDQ